MSEEQATKPVLKMPGHSRQEVQRRRELFIAHYAQTGSGKDAAIAAGYSPKNAAVRAAKLLIDPAVGPAAHARRQAVVEDAEKTIERQANQLRKAADDAIKTLREVATSPDGGGRGAQARVQAAIAILDRAGHKPVERVQSDVSVQDAAKQIDDETARAILEDTVFSRYDGVKSH